jgi:anti-sigma factor RsiW
MAQHFRVDLDGRVYAACQPYISVESYKGKRLVVHAVLVTCPECKKQVAAARAMKEDGT